MPRSRVTIVLHLALLLYSVIAPAQSPLSRRPLTSNTSGLTLDTVLARLESNIDEYERSVPDLFCNEHVKSIMTGYHTGIETTTDSTFRLRKKRISPSEYRFDESRIVSAVNGKPTTGEVDKLTVPTLLIGVFSSGLDVVSIQARSCYQFKIHPARPDHPRDKIVVDFKNLPAKERGPNCPPFERTHGHATVDPVSMHIIRLEKMTEDHELFPGKPGFWEWTINYAPVQLGGEFFWMPTTIRTKCTLNNLSSIWSFDGTYTNYHRFHADAHIVPVAP